MAATNVQAFSGDVEISSNLAVNTDDLFVDTVSGRVGIGTTNPIRPLELAFNDAASIINIKRTDSGGTQGAIAFSNYLSNVCASIVGERYGVEGGELRFFTVPNDTSQTSNNPYLINERMRIDKDGNVGIGTATPGQKLSIYTGSTTVPALSFDRFTSDNYRTDIYQNSYGPDFRVGFGTYAPETMLYLKRLADGSKVTELTGVVGFNATPFTDFVVGGTAAPFAVNTSANSGFCHIGNQSSSNNTLVVGSLGSVVIACDTNANSSNKNIDFRNHTSTDGGTLLMRIEDTGQVGIGLDNPTEPLHVNGNIRGDRIFTHTALPNIDGVYRNYYYINNGYTGWVRIMSRAAGQLNGWAVGEFGRQDGGISAFAYRMRGNGNFQITYGSDNVQLKKNPSSGMGIRLEVLAI